MHSAPAKMFVGFSALLLLAQTPATNMEESKVPHYTLPDPLRFADGTPVRDAHAWTSRRVPEIRRLFEENMYGSTPDYHARLKFEVLSSDKPALDGKARRRQVRIFFGPDRSGPKLDLLLYFPAAATGPVPVFLSPSFAGVQTVRADPGILLGDSWIKEKGQTEPVKRHAAEESRGQLAKWWPVEQILSRGYALATFYYGDVEPDFDGGIKYGIRPLFFKKDQTTPAPGEWGALGAWAFGMSRALDYLQTDPAVDGKHVALMGVSRLGKAALWAGAQDSRFALVISDDSGEGGAALTRRNFGEQIRDVVAHFPYWFCANYRQFVDREPDLPVDQHMLLSLIAPRPLYVASAEEDLWSDPRGEFLSAVNAGPVYRLLGKSDLGTDQMPALNQPIVHTIAYHIRTGKHGINDYDWEQYLRFADLQFGRTAPAASH